MQIFYNVTSRSINAFGEPTLYDIYPINKILSFCPRHTVSTIKFKLVIETKTIHPYLFAKNIQKIVDIVRTE
ncbi:hypothetical protein SDC9_122608 [bioreactor metagenome]|uniref:Uncharacterized protein n=1 Tax=bioreactor metagenome TaxID=1076179 RepID=A0A645CFB7_9ZZZZ